MKTGFEFCFALALALALAACTSVRMEKRFAPGGWTPEKARLDGVWQVDRAYVYLKVASNGVAMLDMPEWKEGNFHVDHGELTAAAAGEANYLCFRMDSDGTNNGGYGFAEYKLSGDDELICWPPNFAAFETALASNRLAGTKEGTNSVKKILLATPPEKLLGFFQDRAGAGLFDYKSPLVFRKVAPAGP